MRNVRVALGWRKGTTSLPTYPPSAPALGTLGLSQTTFTLGVPATGTITGATNGSTITGTLPKGFTINSLTRVWAWDGTGDAGAGTISLTETLSGAIGSPKTTSISYSAAAVVGVDGLLDFSDPNQSGLLVLLLEDF